MRIALAHHGSVDTRLWAECYAAAGHDVSALADAIESAAPLTARVSVEPVA